MHKEQKISKACEWLADKHFASFGDSYGEPGYSNNERGIILANWNNIPRGLADWLEKCGFSLEWSDEWEVIDGKVYRTHADSYSWEPSIALTDDGKLLTPDDSASDWIEYFQLTADGQPIKWLPSWIPTDELTQCGFTLANDNPFESGWFSGQDANPNAIAREAFKNGADTVVFRKLENSQFYCRFECWIRRED